MDTPISRAELLRRGRDLAVLGGLGTVSLGRAVEGFAADALLEAVPSVRTQLAYFPSVTYAGHYIAAERGFYRRERVGSTLLSGGPNIASVEAVVAAGRADVGLGDIRSVVAANKQGAGLVAFAAQFQKNPGGIVSLASNPVRRPRDLVGKRIGLTPGTEVYIDAILKIHNLPLRYSRVPVSGDPAALVNGACDAMVCYVTAQPVTLRLRGVANVAVTLSDLGLPQYGDVLFTTRRYLRRNRRTLIRHLRATIKGYELNERNPAYGARLTVTKYGRQFNFDLHQQTVENRTQIPLMHSNLTRRKGLFWMDLAYIAGPVYAGLRAAGITRLPAPRTYVDLSILREVYRGKRKLLT